MEANPDIEQTLNADFLNELERKLGNSSLNVETVSSFINTNTHDFLDKKTKELAEGDIQLLNQIKENIHRILISGVVHGKKTIVDFLVKCGVNVNVSDDNGNSAADYAWMNKNYTLLLLLLKADSFFPAGFNLGDLSEDDDAKEIKKLVNVRNHFHGAIKNGQVEDLKNFKLNENSKLFLNVENESAAYTALKHKQLDAYAYLKSIGAEFGKHEEKSSFDEIEDFSLKVALQEAMVQWFPAVPNSHVFYLVSKSRSQKPIRNLTETLIYYYGKLNEIPEVSLILKVIQYADYLDIIFDFDEEEISKVNPLASKNTRGEARYKDGRIYIAASPQKRREEEILGTIAHELTHMAMQILYENDCNPYGKSEDTNFFQNFKRRIRRDIRKNSTDPSKILLDALDNYYASDHDSELIVRIPHILAEHKNGRDWIQKNIPEFLNFYKEIIEPKCKQFIDESVIFKPKSIIKSINESVGEIIKLKKCNIFFENVPNLFQNDKKIITYKVESTLLGMLKVLQGLFRKGYTNFYNHFLVLKFKNFITQLTEISQAFFLEGSNVLIIEFSHNPLRHELDRACETIFSLLKEKPHKKVIFVVYRNVMKLLRKTLKENDLEDLSEERFDDQLSFDHLDGDSQKQILKKKITFQGKSIFLKQLAYNPDLCKFIHAGIIEILLEGGTVNVGNEILGMSSLEGPYSDVSHVMDFESFTRGVKCSDDTFILRSNSNEELTEYFSAKFKNKWVNTDFIMNKSYRFERGIYNEKIFLVSDAFQSKDFKNFCRVNSGKKCHLIDVKNLGTDSFILQQFYNPTFYVRRKVKKIFVTNDKMKRLIRESAPDAETFIITGGKNVKKRVLENFNNVKWMDEVGAINTFKKLVESGGSVHRFYMDDDVIYLAKFSRICEESSKICL